MKKFSVAILALLTALLLPAIAGAQTAPAVASNARPNAPATKTDEAQVVVTPAMKLESQLRVRNLQYSQDKALLEMRQIEARHKELQETVRSLDQQINDEVRASGVDPVKFVFDLDTLKFVPRPAPAVNQSTTKPWEENHR